MANVLEAGHIYFFYRPRVQHDEAKGLEDIQRFHFILSPRGKRVWRLLTIGRKRMPEVKDGGERVWAFVDKVGHEPREVEDELDRQIYGTKTRGERVRPEARPAGEGVYTVVAHGDHTHLAYELEFPKEPGEVQRELNIEEQGSYVVTVKNPDAPSPPWAGFRRREKVELPAELARHFRGRRFAELTPELLDQEGTELVLVGAKETPEAELGITLEPEEEDETNAAIFDDLKLERAQHPLEPLFTGEWR
jgi:hypothetical protein